MIEKQPDTRMVLHTKLTGEIVLSVFHERKLLAALPMGTIESEAREKAKSFIETIKTVETFYDETQ